VTLTVTDGGGLSNSTTKSITVSPPPPAVDAPPVARFTYSCAGLTCTLNASTSTDDVGITSYVWDLNKYPGGSASGVTVTVDYPHSGTRYPTLTVTDTKGQKSSVTQTIVIP
jgi:PKD repeat protein